MRIAYGTYAMDLNCAEYDILLQSLRDKVLKESSLGNGGVKLYTLDEYRNQDIRGYALLGDATGSAIIGVAYKNAESSRLWFIPSADDKHTLFIDGYPTIVEAFDLIYEVSTGYVISPVNDNKILIGPVGL